MPTFSTSPASLNGPSASGLRRDLTLLDAAAVFALWQTKAFGTHEIAQVLNRPEFEIANILRIKDGPEPLHVIAGGKS